MELAPVVLFVYNRPWHLKCTIETLKKNKLAKKTELFIYSDAPRNKDAEEKVKEVRRYIKLIDGFKKVTIIERGKNLGLAGNIINGVTEVINKYGKIVVLEDDLVTSPCFLKYMNEALDFYKNRKKVWHISAWNYPVKLTLNSDVFLWRFMNCWGWATWKDRWKYFIKEIDELISIFSLKEAYKFSLNAIMDSWYNLIANKIGIKNVWAVFWNATIYLNKGLCVNPVISLVRNIGCDGSGSNCKKFSFEEDQINLFHFKEHFLFEHKLQENMEVVEQIMKFIKKRKGFVGLLKTRLKFTFAALLFVYFKSFKYKIGGLKW